MKRLRYRIAMEMVMEIDDTQVDPGDGFMDVNLGQLDREQETRRIEDWEFIETQAINEINPDGSTGRDLLREEQQTYRLNEQDCRPKEPCWQVKNVRQNPRDATFYIADIVEGGTRVAQVAGIGREQAEARARLVVQAPNLLKELRLMVIQCPCGNHVNGIDFNKSCLRCTMALRTIKEAQ